MPEIKRKWNRDRDSGNYNLPGTGYEITQEEDDNGEFFWGCRTNGVLFDRADTVEEAKSYCQ